MAPEQSERNNYESEQAPMSIGSGHVLPSSCSVEYHFQTIKPLFIVLAIEGSKHISMNASRLMSQFLLKPGRSNNNGTLISKPLLLSDCHWHPTVLTQGKLQCIPLLWCTNASLVSYTRHAHRLQLRRLPMVFVYTRHHVSVSLLSTVKLG